MSGDRPSLSEDDLRVMKVLYDYMTGGYSILEHPSRTATVDGEATELTISAILDFTDIKLDKVLDKLTSLLIVQRTTKDLLLSSPGQPPRRAPLSPNLRLQDGRILRVESNWDPDVKWHYGIEEETHNVEFRVAINGQIVQRMTYPVESPNVYQQVMHWRVSVAYYSLTQTGVQLLLQASDPDNELTPNTSSISHAVGQSDNADKIKMRVALSRFKVSNATLRRAIKNKKLHDYRPKNAPPNAEMIFSEAELATHYERR